MYCTSLEGLLQYNLNLFGVSVITYAELTNVSVRNFRSNLAKYRHKVCSVHSTLQEEQRFTPLTLRVYTKKYPPFGPFL
jgi:hypothetical protein